MAQPAEKRDHKATAIKDAAFNWEDPLDLESELTEEERMVRDTARDYAQDKLFPRVLKAYHDESYDPAIILEMGALGLLGPTIPEEYGGAGLGYVAYGLIAREIERVDPAIARQYPAERTARPPFLGRSGQAWWEGLPRVLAPRSAGRLWPWRRQGSR